MKTKQLISLLILTVLATAGIQAQQLNANFRADKTNGCAPAVVNFEDLSFGNPTNWLWDFGNGSTSTLRKPSTTYLQPGKYTITLIIGNDAGDKDTVVKDAYVNIFDNPKPEFSASSVTGCSPVRVQFSDASIADPSNRIVKWSWDLGDGNLIETQNPEHVYRGVGDYAVTLKVTDDKGCSGVLLKPQFVKVSTGVTTNFTNTTPTVCSAPATVTFTNRSTGPGTLTHTWLFGDGNTSNTASPRHTYTTNDTFNVSLVVSSSLGCFDTLTKKAAVIVGGFKSDFRFRDNNVCPGTPVQLQNTSVPQPTASRWLFPDGTTSTQVNPTKTFNTSGPVQIRLINTFDGCSDTLIKTLNIAEPPKISFTASDTAKCTPSLTTRFTNTTVGGVSYFWEFGDSTFSTEVNPSHTYTEFGNYNVKLTVTSAAGCVVTATKNNYIKISEPTVRLSPQNGCIPFETTLEARVTSAEQVVSYQWDLGDGTTSTAEKPKHTYTRAGNYRVSVTITTASGCTASYTLDNAIRVGTKPKAAFSANPLDVCAADGIQFTNSSTGADSYEWIFGDGGSSKVANPKYVFSDTGNIDVTLIAFRSGCGDTLFKPQYIHIKPPVSKFSFTPTCGKPLEYTFKDESIDAAAWLWNFGDGKTSTERNPPLHVFPSEGTYKVTLTTTKGECSSSRTLEIVVGKRPINFRANRVVFCNPARIEMDITTGNEYSNLRSLVWVFSNNDTVITRTTSFEEPRITLPVSGNFDVKLVTIDTFGCRRDSVTRLNYLRINGPTADFTSANRLTCTDRTVNFEDRSKTDGVNQIVKWEWSYGLDNKDTVYTAPPFSKFYDSTGTFNVRLEVTDAAGCTNAIIKRNYVQTTVVKPDFTGDTQTCPNGPTPVQFNSRTTGSGFTYLWNFGDGGTSTQAAPRYTYKDTGRYSVTLRVTNANGCTDSITKRNFVYSGLPKADFDANNFVSFCTPYEAKFKNTSTYYSSLLWNLGQGNSTLANPVAYYAVKGTYDIRLIATSPGGCRDTITKPLVVRDPSDGKLNYVAVNDCSPLSMDFDAFEEMNGRFIWDFGDGNVVDTNTHKITHNYTDFGSYIPSVILYEPAGCVLTLKGRDTINAIGVEAKFGINQSLFCDEGMLRIIDSTRTNDRYVRYSWTFGDGGTSTESNPIHFYNKPGEYFVQLVTETFSGCRDTSALVPVKVSISPRILLDGDTALCERERRPYRAILQNLDSTDVTWRWQLPDGTSSTVQSPGVMIFPAAGSFPISVISTNRDGCADTIATSITVHPRPQVSIPPLFTIPSGTEVLLPASYSSSVRQYFWSPPEGLNCTDCPQPIAKPINDTRYTINVVDSNGCRNSAETQVDVVCYDANVFAPNTFSPNGDGRNDVFYIRGTGLDRVRVLRVFNRWGEVVFERREFPANDASYGWDGKFKGIRPLPDVYVYQAEVYCASGEVVKLQGNVALIQ